MTESKKSAYGDRYQREVSRITRLCAATPFSGPIIKGSHRETIETAVTLGMPSRETHRAAVQRVMATDGSIHEWARPIRMSDHPRAGIDKVGC